MCLSLSLSGIPFCGADIGGFTGDQNPQVMAKWYAHATFQPFFRAHAHNTVFHREPWKMGKYSEVIKEYLYMRQSLLPYM